MNLGRSPRFSRKKTFLILAGLLWGGKPFSARALELDLYPVDRFSRDTFSFSVFREERPSFYWVNAGVPDAFFSNVNQTSSTATGGTLSYIVRSVEYGFHWTAWVTPQLQVRGTLPFEANALSDPAGTPHEAQKFGDLEIASAYLLLGSRENGNTFGAEGRLRFPTGSNPFTQAYPLLASGRGGLSGSLGLFMRQEAGGFSFFEGIDYEKSEVLSLDPSSFLGSGAFSWPDTIHALGRVEWEALRRGQRLITLFYELRLRATGPMRLGSQELPYADGQKTLQLFFSTVGMSVQVDRELTVEGHGSYFPLAFSSRTLPDTGILFSLAVAYHIL